MLSTEHSKYPEIKKKSYGNAANRTLWTRYNFFSMNCRNYKIFIKNYPSVFCENLLILSRISFDMKYCCKCRISFPETHNRSRSPVRYSASFRPISCLLKNWSDVRNATLILKSVCQKFQSSAEQNCSDSGLWVKSANEILNLHASSINIFNFSYILLIRNLFSEKSHILLNP